jgi:hypothetical protein
VGFIFFYLNGFFDNKPKGCFNVDGIVLCRCILWTVLTAAIIGLLLTPFLLTPVEEVINGRSVYLVGFGKCTPLEARMAVGCIAGLPTGVALMNRIDNLLIKLVKKSKEYKSIKD